jgi:peroxiredoxin
MRTNYSGSWGKHSHLSVCLILACLATYLAIGAPRTLPQQQQIVWTDQEIPIFDKIRTLRKLPDKERARTTKELALEIRQLPAGMNKVRLATSLAGLSTEGDFGHDTLQEVATTLTSALRGYPLPATPNGPPMQYVELAQLVRYEHVEASLDDPQYTAAVAKVEADDVRHQQANFTLTDMQGKSWTLKDLHGKVVLVNFWATWCPPCRSEMPDLEALYKQFKDQGFVILAISDEEATKVKPYIEEFHYSYPILLDPGRKVNEAYSIEGIPKSFVYDREGRLVAQSIDMRTNRQFLEMLAQAGLR